MIGEIILSPQLVTTIRDTRPGDAWLAAVKELEDKVRAVRARGEVRAAHEVGMVVEGLRQKVSCATNGAGHTMAKMCERCEGKTQARGLLAKRASVSRRAKRG